MSQNSSARLNHRDTRVKRPCRQFIDFEKFCAIIDK